MLILCAIAGGLLCLTCFIFLVVHPLVCIFECALSKTLSGSQKATWIVVSFFTGIFGSLVYALFASGSPRLRSLTLTGMKLGTVNLLLAIGAFAATPEVREFISNPFSDLSVETLAIETTVESMMEDSDLASVPVEETSVPVEETNDTQAAPGQQYVAVVTDTLEAQTAVTADDNADLFAMLAEEGDIAPTEIEVPELVPAPVQAAPVETELVQQPVRSTNELDPAVSILDSVSTAETDVESENLVASGIETDSPADTTLPTDLGDTALVPESITNTSIAPEIVVDVDDVDTVESENAVANTLEAESTEADLLESPNAVGDILESTSKTNSPIDSAPVEPALPAPASVETPKTNMASSQLETRASQPVKLALPEKSAKKNRINRYRVEGYPVYEVTVSPTPTVRNRYTNQ